MSTLQYNVGTKNLSGGTLSFTAESGVRIVSMILVSGTVTFTGSLPVGGADSDAITLVSGVAVTIGGDEPLNGLTIDATAGVVTVIIRN